MENGPFIVDLPIKNVWFSTAMLNYQREVIENGHRNSGFSINIMIETIVMKTFTRGYPGIPKKKVMVKSQMHPRYMKWKHNLRLITYPQKATLLRKSSNLIGGVDGEIPDQWKSFRNESHRIKLGMCHSYLTLPEGNGHSSILRTQQQMTWQNMRLRNKITAWLCLSSWMLVSFAPTVLASLL